MKKYELTNETKTVDTFEVHRIRYIRDIPDVGIKAGMMGGFLENEDNLSHEDDCVVLDEAVVCGEAKVLDYAVISDSALITKKTIVKNQARVSGSTVVSNSKVFVNASIEGKSIIQKDSRIYGNAHVSNTKTKGEVSIFDDAVVLSTVLDGLIDIKGSSEVRHSRIQGMGIVIMDVAAVQESKMKNAKGVVISNSAKVAFCAFEGCDRVRIKGNAKIEGVLKPRVASSSGSLIISGNDIDISGDATIEGKALLVGDNISMTENASIIGTVRVGNNVKLSEIALVENRELYEQFICDVELSMDNFLLQEDS